ncbi:RNA polymerase sigma factor [Jejuia spongiicola]|uniref:Sigma-70 family RNA polymerase sigma factor n=1 Tax=Jejuia spongiicola TaxID=2942207 RepID=A0ABT0QGX0_9FLAO|nr:sigma-70 family RNA polymerase sigma factor [Jejuia spongiicola]MCL6296236.1 sigma-70 family RNA polymerase sigma factor [Jejuia spongiicola]
MLESNLIEGLKKGDKHVLKHIYISNKAAFLNFAKKYPISKEEIVDIYQDSIVALRENAINGKIDDLKSTLKTYLFSIGKYMIYKKLKQNKKMHLIDDLLEFETSNELKAFNEINNELSQEQVQLQRAFKNLGQKCKDVLTLFYYRGFNLEEIMVELNYTNKDVVKSQKSRCIKTLKTMILKHNNG